MWFHLWYLALTEFQKTFKADFKVEAEFGHKVGLVSFRILRITVIQEGIGIRPQLLDTLNSTHVSILAWITSTIFQLRYARCQGRFWSLETKRQAVIF